MRVVDLVEFLRRHVAGRRVGDGAGGGGGGAGAVVVKLDVEGLEFDLVPKLLAARDVACAVDVWLVEWHWWYDPSDARGPPDRSPTRDELARAAPPCTRVVAFDDETYWRDPAPFPAKLNATAPELPWGGFIA